ncbi:glutaminase A [Agromyces sp. LHK192]|uniref:glutaminase A n=1 Tax=Agromyces sp. LHK192 TaxID=2498704 RepID=UPI000FD70E72|nr:glutaminase A [Agromyces sp. LHK192]
MPLDLDIAVQAILDRVLDRARPVGGGELADYIPELAAVDPDRLGIAIASVRGDVHVAGDADTAFTIQSVSKPFVFALAVDALGLEAVLEHVGLEPSGEPFNAISLDEATGRPLNPMINAGAIVTSSLILGGTAEAKAAHIVDGLGRFAARDLVVDEEVFSSEAGTADRNLALAHLARATGALTSSVEVATTAYFRQCSVAVTARDLSIMAATLAAGGVNPLTGDRVISADAARWTTSVMTSCGMYDESGTWLVRVGLPSKSGVGGGIVAVQPGQFGIGTFSPRLDARGNSVRGVAILEALSARFGLHVLSQGPEMRSPIAAVSEDGDHRIAHLRGELHFAQVEELATRLRPLLGGDGCLVLDLEGVTRVGGAVREVLRELPSIVGPRPDGGPAIALRDPDGVLDPER